MSLIIKEVAKSKGITLTELADRLGITKSGMNQHVNGNTTVEVLQRIADALNVHISDLFEKPQAEEVTGFVEVFLLLINAPYLFAKIQMSCVRLG